MDQLIKGLLTTAYSTPRPVDDTLISKAYEFAKLAHADQKRKSSQLYITHPVAVATHLADWNMDTTTIMAGLLHDTIEDGGATKNDIVNEFGSDVAAIVEGVTKVSGFHLTGSTDEKFVENLRKMFLAMSKDMRVVMVKFADRLHNLETIQYLSPDRQWRYAREILEVFSPLADRLGLYKLKNDLENLAFPYAYPEEYKNLVSKTKKVFEKSDILKEKFRQELLKLLIPELPRIEINIRRKHLYSLFRKLQKPEIGGEIEKIYDIVAARVITNTIAECYQALGLVHNHFRHVPYLGVSDFIASPKANGYQSIHTKVFGSGGAIIEVQFRTKDMHEQAEMGIAAHWAYTGVKNTGVSDEILEKGLVKTPKKLTWIKQLATWQKEISDDSEFLHTLTVDALSLRIFALSPIGDVYDLPDGATPIDYAYAVHTNLGHHAIGAKVNGEMVPLDKKLKNGNVVEILLDKKKKLPNAKWLDFVVTHTARKSIQKALSLH